jgi:hypothetical protein
LGAPGPSVKPSKSTPRLGWVATSDDAPGLVVEAASQAKRIEQVRLILPDLIEIDEKG